MVKGLIVTGFWLVVFFFAGEIWAAPACGVQVAVKVGHFKNKWAYKSDHWGAEIRPGNETQFYPSKTRKAALLIHGYGGSPFEMSAVAKVLREEGYSVLSILIPGFGSTAKVANQARVTDWRQAVVESMDLLSSCYQEISLVGFSTGGTLITDFFLHSSKLESDGTYGSAQIKKVILLSPFYRFRSFWSELIVSATVSQKSVNVQTLWNSTHLPDLKPFVTYPDFYNSDLPTLAGEKISELGKEVEGAAEEWAEQNDNQNRQGAMKIRSLTVITRSDLTADPGVTEDVVRSVFQRPAFLEFGLFEFVPHHVMVPTNPKLSSVLNRIRQFAKD